MQLPFRDRSHAGQLLAEALNDYRGRSDLLILALPRGGVPVAVEVAETLQAPLDLMLVRKLGVPGHEELAMGAIATGGARVLNDEIVRQVGITEQMLDDVTNRERQELHRREQTYRGDRPAPQLRDQCVVLIDDGLATGATMLAAVDAARQHGPAELIVAVPVAPPDTCYRLQERADRVIVLATPEPFGGVGQWYANFEQTTDEEVRDRLGRARSQRQVQPGHTP